MCVESHKQATENCPNVYAKKIRICKEVSYCELNHIPPEPPKISKMMTCSCYDLMTCDGNWRGWLGQIAEEGANGCRIFVLQTWGQKYRMDPFQPYPVIGTWCRPDIDKNFPLFQLRKEGKPLWNPEWWAKYRQMLEEFKFLDLRIDIVGDDYCSLKKGKKDKYNHPYYCSLEALEEFDPPTPGGVWGKAMKKYRVDLYKRLIQEAIDVGVDFTFEVMNEYDAKDWDDDFMVKWHEWAVGQSRNLGAEIIIASAMRNKKRIKEKVDIYSQHGVVKPSKVDKIHDEWGDERDILISGDGGFDGNGTADKKGRRGASPEQMRGIARKIYDYGYEGYEYFDRGLYKRNNNRANLNDFDDKALIAFVDECRKLENKVSRLRP